MLTVAAASLALPVSMALPAASASAQTHHARAHHYRASSHRHYTRCRHSPGNAGLIAGGVGGALVGRSVLGHGLLGTVAGGVGGALGGRAIDRTVSAKHRCR
jgi:outer membrane lipoprotein SlyB